MKKTLVLFASLMFLVAGVAAERYVVNNMQYAEFDNSGNVHYPGTPLYGYSAVGYVCGNSDCSSIAGSLWSGQTLTTSGNSMQVSFPTDLQSSYGYGVYYYKPGYITWEQTSSLWGTTPDDPISTIIYNAKINGCNAPIENFAITNEVQPNVPVVINVQARLDATTYSAIKHAGPLNYVPPQLAADYYSVKTKVTLQIFRNDVLVYSDTRDMVIPFSSSANVQFTWTPTQSGDYYAQVFTDITDAKCLASVRQYADKAFKVLEDEPNSQCYAIINDLASDNQFPRAGETIRLSYTKISNYAYDDYSLTAVPASVLVDIIRESDGMAVHEKAFDLPANPNAKDKVFFSFDWNTAGQGEGIYNVIVTATAKSTLCSGLPNIIDQTAMEIILLAPQTYAPVLDGLPDLNMAMNAPAKAKFVNLWDYTTDQDTADDKITYYLVSQSDPELISCFIDSGHYVSCNAPAYNSHGTSYITIEANDGTHSDRDSFIVTVERTASGPVISNIPNIEFYVGECYSLDLDNYVTDADNSLSELVWSVSGNINVDITINPSTHVAEFCSDWVGQEQVVFKVADPDGLFDTDNVIVTVLQRDTAPAISGLPDREFCAGSGLQENIIDLWNYAEDGQTADQDLIFTIASQSNHDAAHCYIQDGHYLSCNIYDIGTNDIVVQVSDGRLADTDAMEVRVIDCHQNAAPSLDNLPDKEFCSGSGEQARIIDLWQYAQDAETPDSQLVFTITSQSNRFAADCRIQDGHYLSCYIDDIGVSQVTVQVSDGELADSDTLNINVKDCHVNAPPCLDNLPDQRFCKSSGLHSRVIDLWQYASDAESADSELVFAIVDESNPSSSHCVIENNRYVSCSASSTLGVNTVTIEVSDGEFEVVSDFKVTVESCEPINTAPEICNLPDQEFCAGSGVHHKIVDLWQYASDAEQPDSQLVFTIKSQGNAAAGNCFIEEGHWLSCEAKAIGQSEIVVQVSDGKLTDTDKFLLKVKDCAPVNTAPDLCNLPDQEFCANSGVHHKIVDLWQYASDAEQPDSQLVFTIKSQSNAAVGNCFIEEGHWLSCDAKSIGQSEVVVQVSDGKLTDTDSFILKVKDCAPPNTAPVIENLPDQEFCNDCSIHHKILDLWNYASDAEQQDSQLVFTILSQSSAAVGNCFIEEGHWLSCEAKAIGQSEIVMQVSDGKLTDTDSFILKVKDCAPPNTAPVIENLPDQKFCAGSGSQPHVIDLWQYAYDAETADSQLTFSIDSPANSLGLSCYLEDNRYVSCQVADSVGSISITISVSDGKLSDSEGFMLSAEKCNYPPGVIVISPKCKEIVSGVTQISWSATDPENDILYITIEYSPNNGYQWFTLASYIENTGAYMWDTRLVPDQATYLIRITATDGTNTAQDTTDCTFTVNNNIAVIPEDTENEKYEVTIYRIIMEDRLQPDDTLWVKMDLENTGDYRLEDVRARISIMDLGYSKTLGPFDMSRGEDKSLQGYIELFDAPEGVYDVQIQVWNQNIKRTIYREIRVMDCGPSCAWDEA